MRGWHQEEEEGEESKDNRSDGMTQRKKLQQLGETERRVGAVLHGKRAQD